MHRRPSATRRAHVALGARAAAVPGLDRVALARAPGWRSARRPASGCRRAATPPRATSCATRSAASAATPTARASWAKAARRWPTGAQADLLDAYRLIDVPTLLLWADEDPVHPLAIAEEALDLLPDAQLRVLAGTGFLMAYDDPVGLARELAAFCG